MDVPQPQADPVPCRIQQPVRSMKFGIIRTIVEAAEAGVRGIGIPGVEAVPAILMKLLNAYQVCRPSYSPYGCKD